MSRCAAHDPGDPMSHPTLITLHNHRRDGNGSLAPIGDGFQATVGDGPRLPLATAAVMIALVGYHQCHPETEHRKPTRA